MVHAPSNLTALSIDRDQAATQLRLLGYKPGDNVYMRFFVPDGDPRHGTPAAARKADKLNWEQIERYQNDGYGVYFVINGGGHADSDVRQGRSLFCEWDDRPIEDQILAWQELKLLEPSMQVGTRKSIHNYWRADLTKEQWVELQEDLLAYTQSDQKLKNPSRVLRLAGAWHIKPGCEPVRCDIIHQSERVYTYEELRAAIPRRQQAERPIVNDQPSIPDDVPLYQCLTKDDRTLIDQGAAQGSRNSSGAKLARNLIGTAQRLNYLGIRFDGDPRQLFDSYCSRCAPALASREAVTIWKSASRDNPTASLTDDALENCAKAWLRNQGKTSGRGFSGGIGSGGGRRGGSGGSGGSGDDGGDGRRILRFPATELNMAAIREQIKDILSQDLPPSELEATKIQIRVAAPAISERELRQLWNAVELELELEQSRGDRAKEIDDLVKLGDQSLNLPDFLPADLSQPVGAWCQWLSIRPEAALTALLSATSSLHKTGTELIISRKQNFTVPPTINGALISESGQKKSPIYRTLVRQPLDALEIDAEEQFKAAMQDWREEMKVWQANGGQGEAPAEPVPPPIWYFTDANGEGIKAQAHKHPSKSLMGLVDELAGLFNSYDKYRNGKGSDRQDMLSYFDGTGAKVLRASGVKVNVRKLYLSLFGTIQPDVLKRMMSDCSDPDGQWARFLFVNQPLTASELDDDNYSVDIVERITDFYRWLDKVPEMEYTLSKAAYDRYKPVYKQLESLRVSHPQAGMRAMYAKMEGYIGRLAINLHAFHEWAAFKAAPDAEIPLEIMQRAIALAKFYIGQVKLVHFNSDDSELAPTLVRLINYSKLLESVGKDGWVKAKDFVNTITKNKRPKVDVARSWMREAESLGFGCTRGIGCHLEYHWRSDNKPDSPPDLTPKKVDEVDKKETKVDESSTAEMTIYQAFQEKVDEVDDLSTFSNHTLDNTQYCAEEQTTSNTLEVEHNISGDSSTSSTFSCNDRISMVPVVDESSTFYLPENQASTFLATGSVSTIDTVDSEIASTSLAAGVTNNRVNFLASRFPHCNITSFKSYCRNEKRKDIEAALQMLKEADKERVLGFWERIKNKFAPQ